MFGESQMNERRSLRQPRPGRSCLGFEFGVFSLALVGTALFGVLAGSAQAQGPGLGARFDDATKDVSFRVFSARATRIEVYLYANPFGEDEKLRVPLTK